MYFFIGNHFGVVAAAIQGDVDCEDYVSHFRLEGLRSYFQIGYRKVVCSGVHTWKNSAKVVLLDRVLAHYGPETKEIRVLLRDLVTGILERTWPKNREKTPGLEAPSIEAEGLIAKIQGLSPKDENQTWIKSQALSIAWVVGQTRWLQFAQQAVSISIPLLVTLVFWLIAIFVSFGLFAPRNTAVVVCMFISAASVSGAILMILEMYSPYRGLMQLSSAPLRAALAQLGR